MRQARVSLVAASRWRASETAEGNPLEGMHYTCRLYTAEVPEGTVSVRQLVADQVHMSSIERHRSPIERRTWPLLQLNPGA